MRNLNGLKLISILALASGIANADLILDGASVIPTNDTNTVTVDPANGDIYIDTFSQDYTVTSGGTTPPPPGSVTINSFTVSPTSMLEGEQVTLSWTTSDADSCTGTATGDVGGWNGAAVARNFNGLNITIATAGAYTFTLQCAGNNGPVTRNRSVIVNEPAGPTPANCTTPPLVGGSTLWRTFWHVDFPGPSYDNELLRLARGGYWALEFNTGDIVDHGGVLSVANTSSNGTRLGAISACPGDFDVEPECTHSWGSSGGIGWATDGQAGYCRLLPDTTYYMNFTFTDGFDTNTDTCQPTEACNATLQHINLN